MNERIERTSSRIVSPINFVFVGFTYVIYSRSISLIERKGGIERKDRSRRQEKYAVTFVIGGTHQIDWTNQQRQ